MRSKVPAHAHGSGRKRDGERRETDGQADREDSDRDAEGQRQTAGLKEKDKHRATGKKKTEHEKLIHFMATALNEEVQVDNRSPPSTYHLCVGKKREQRN